MRFRTLAASVVAGTAAVVLGGAAMAAQAAVQVTAVGWWTSSVAPPSVPDGGIAVSNDPSGFSVGAIRLDVGGGLSSATLKLVEAANQVDKLASMQVCGAADTWSPARGGAADQAPSDTCSAGSVPLAQQADGSWTADVHQLLAGKTGSASVIVKPAANAAAFQVSFEAPTVDGVTVDSSSSGSSAGASSSAPATSSDTASSPSASPSSSSADTGSPGFSAPSFATPPSVSASPDLSSTPAPAPAVASAAPAANTATPAASDASAAPANGGQFKANIAGGTSSGHHATRGTAVGVFALALLIGAVGGGASWAKANGLFEIAGLRERFSR